MELRLEKYCGQAAKLSRSQIKAALRQKRVTLNGQLAKGGEKVDPAQDVVCLDGKPLCWQQHIYLMLNKPTGVVSATRDSREKTVLDLVPQEYRRPGLFPAGRLDKETTGFVLITDDGEFAHRMLSPKHHVEKAYRALLAGSFTTAMAEQFEKGCVLKDGYQCLPARIKLLEQRENAMVEIVLREGKYHQIRRMAAACGSRVLELKRIRLGGLFLDPGLKPGECREILHKELLKILTTSTPRPQETP